MKLLVPLALGLLTLTALPFAQEASDAPEEERGLRVNAEGAFEGYTLIAPLSSTKIHLIDMEGEVVHEWETGYPHGAIYLLDDGHLLRCARLGDSPRFNGGGIGGIIEKIDWDGNVVWSYQISDDFVCQHHDIEPMPNGNILVIAWEHRFMEDAIAYGRDPAQIGEPGMWPDAVYELQPIGTDDAEIVWEWHTWDHLIQDFDENAENYGSIPDDPGRHDINADHRDQPPMTEEERLEQEKILEQMKALGYVGDDYEEEADAPDATRGQNNLPDWQHTNGLDYHPELDLIVLSVPQMSEIWIIDHSTSPDDAAYDSGGRWKNGGDILYRWGNPRNYGRGDDSDVMLGYQHNPIFVAGDTPDELRVLVFNNNVPGAEPAHSAADELLLPFDPNKGFLREPDAAFGPKEPIWTYRDPGGFHSSFISGVQRLPNGNTLICSGAPGRVFEVTREGRIVWDYRNPFQGEAAQGQGGGAPPLALFRAERYAPDHPGLKGRF